MSLHGWLQILRSALAPRRGQRQHQRRGSHRAATRRLNLEVLEDRLTPSFTWGGSYAGWGPESPPLPLSADFTSDGIDDLLDIAENGAVVVRPGRGDGTFADPIYTGIQQGFLAVADFNGDSQLDVFSAWGVGLFFPGGSGTVSLGRGDGFFGWGETFLVPEAQRVGTGDFDGDGRPDVAVTGYDDLEGAWVVVVLLNDGNWGWGPYLSFSNATVTEGNSGTANATFTLTLDHASNVDLTVHYATADNSATAGTDYVPASGTLTIPAGQTAGTITVLVNGDSLPEPNESFRVYLSSPTNAVVTIGYGTGAIVDDEPHLSVSDATFTEGNAGTANATFSVTLDTASTEPVTAAYATADGTASAGSDYQAASGMLTFAPGETSKTITVLVNGDRLPEPNETLAINLSAATNATIADGQGVGTMTDDEPRITISDVVKREGRKNTTSFTFTVALSTAYDEPVTMSFRTVDGTARTSDSDYVARTGTLTFAPGETTKTITIEVKGDSKKEANETFYLDLFGLSSNALFTKNRGIGTILNDD
jgi:Calx-beta domain-containing protein/VCBS repeat protein